MPRLTSLGRQLVTLGVCLTATMASAAPAAGTSINNQGRVRFVDSASSQSSGLNSNTVQTVVQGLEAVSLDPSRQLQLAPGAALTLAHRLLNDGNSTATFALTLAAPNNVLPLRIVHDLNGNGAVDAGEPAVQSLTLAARAAANLIIAGTVPASMSAGSQFTVTISAAGQAARASVDDTVSVINGATIRITQSTSKALPRSGDQLALCLHASNVGNSMAAGADLTVDGVAMTAVILTQLTPLNTRLVDAPVPAGLDRLFHRIGAPSMQFTRTMPSDPAQVDAVVFARNQLAVGDTMAACAQFELTPTVTEELVVRSQAAYRTTTGAAPTLSDSVSLVIPVQTAGASLAYYDSEGFARKLLVTTAGKALFLEATAGVCNTATAQAETVIIRIRSERALDDETYEALETSPNSGIFRVLQPVPTLSSLIQKATRGDGILGVAPRDVLHATINGCAAEAAQADVLIDPFGIVFDSRSNVPVAGAVVRLIDVDGAGNGNDPGGLARVFADDGVTASPSILTTGADGSYVFPLVAPSRYRLDITPPAGYRAPSALPADLQPAGRIIHVTGSYGGIFAVNQATGAVNIDVPLDPSSNGAMRVEKQASRSVVALGEFVDYQIRVRNVAGVALPAVVLEDRLPLGFTYQRHSMRLNGQPLADPVEVAGRVLRVPLATLAPSAVARLTYRVAVGPGAQVGDGINRAQAHSAGPPGHSSNVAQVTVRVDSGVFSDRAFVVGTVYLDCNRNRLQDADEPGVPGIQIWLQDGTYATTDHSGRYHFEGLAPRTHVAKLDLLTLPAGAEPMALDPRHAGYGATRFIDLKNGALVRADFALGGCSPALLHEVVQRRQQVHTQRAMAEPITRPLTLDTPVAADPRTRPDRSLSPLVPAPAPASTLPASSSPTPAIGGVAASVDAASAAAQDKLQTALQQNPDNMFLDLRDGARLPTRQTRVRVQGPANGSMVLQVNGTALAQDRIATRQQLPASARELREYLGVNLQPGANTLELFWVDDATRSRAQARITVIAPGDLHHFRIQVPSTGAVADGNGNVQVRLFLEDVQGLPVTSRTAVTLDGDTDSWHLTDLDPAQAGVQIFVEGGEAVLTVRAPTHAGLQKLRVHSDAITGEADLHHGPALRDLMVVGLVEGVLDLKRMRAGSLLSPRRSDGFEQELQRIKGNNDGQRAGARTAFFLRGRILGDTLLTMAYDSDKDTQERLFRDIQPDKYYPVYGDGSTHGFDAQSTSRLYVRIERGRSWLLYGDFATPGDNTVRQLSAYHRSLTGLRHHLETDTATADFFLSRDNTRLAVQEFRANGTSGPFLLTSGDILEQSERVEILVRDRNQPARILQSRLLQRFLDYDLEPLSGRLLLRAPLSSVDPDLNPQAIRISYEVAQGGSSFWIAGAQGELQLGPNLAVGGMVVKDDNPLAASRLVGAHARYQDGPTTVVAEVAQSRTDANGTGMARRLEWRHVGPELQLRAQTGSTDAQFDNPFSNLLAGRRETTIRVSYKIDERTRLVGDMQSSTDRLLGDQREGYLIGVERSFDDNVRLEFGVRHVRQQLQTAVNGQTDFETRSLRVKLAAPMPGVPRATVYGEAEQAIGDSSQHLLAVGADYALAGGFRLYGRHEFVSSLAGPLSLQPGERRNTTIVGLEAPVSDTGRAFGEYRIRDAIAGREAEAAMGLRNQWLWAPGIRLLGSIERIQPMLGPETRASTALAGGIEWFDNPDLKFNTRLELRHSPDSDGLLHTAALAWKFQPEWTMLARHIYNRTRATASGTREQHRFQLGVAWREQAPYQWNGLARYEYRDARDDQATAPMHRRTHIVSLHGHYMPSATRTMSMRFAAKDAFDQSGDIASRARNQLVSARLTQELSARWDFGIQASTLFSSDGRARQRGLGAEIGYRVCNDIWVSVGANVFGFRDAELQGDDYLQRGAYLRLRIKFDENSFSRSSQGCAP